MNRSRFFAIMLAGCLIASATLAQTAAPERTLTGTYTCLACDMAKSLKANAQCEQFGHLCGIKLSDGTYVQFLPNDHSQELVKWHGRTDFKITVTGTYDRASRVIDVHKYVIDGVETVWSATEGKMVKGAKHQDLLPKEKETEKLTKTDK